MGSAVSQHLFRHAHGKRPRQTQRSKYTGAGQETLSKNCPTKLTGQGQTRVLMCAKLLICMAPQVALLTIYDMCKAVDRGMTITDVKLLEKHGGKSGSFVAGT